MFHNCKTGKKYFIHVVIFLMLTAQAVFATTYTVINTNDSGIGSLREAILNANANPGLDYIEFDIPGVGPHTIQPLSFLPYINDPVIIDGYTQAGAHPNTNGPGLGSNAFLKIELDGTNAGSANGLTISVGNSTVRGLVINRFSFDGIMLMTNGGNLIEGNFIGTDVTGTNALGNFLRGVVISGAHNNTIGGTMSNARNVISGNGITFICSGVAILGSSATENLVQGNFIGTDVSGSVDLGNSGAGVSIGVGASGNTIGGMAGARNIISGNDLRGVTLGADGNVVQGNLIGTDVTGTADLGNSGSGVGIFGASGNTIGGIASGADNTIAFNIAAGVLVTSGTCNGILTNSIFSNVGLGIDLSPGGVTPNDPGDGDTGPNNKQNFPVLTSSASGGGSTTIEGTLNSTANTTFRLEFFANTEIDPSGHGEGEGLIGSTDVTTDGSGNVSFMVTFPVEVPATQFTTATATDPNNNSSEFSGAKEVISAMIEVSVDIKPQSCPNPLNIKSQGVLPVAILGRADCDVSSIDPSSILLEGVSPIRNNIEDVATPIEKETPCDCTEEGPDGYEDLTLKFKTQDIVAALGDVEDGEVVVLTLIGTLTDDTPIEGTDCVVIHKKGKTGSTASENNITSNPTEYKLKKNYPNPFSFKTTIKYDIPIKTKVRLEIFNILGQKVNTLVDESQIAGYYSMIWDGRDKNGKEVPTGVYLYKLEAREYRETKKMMLVR